MDLKKIRKLLSNVDCNFQSRNSEQIFNFLSKEKVIALKRNDETRAKEIWCLENILDAQDHFLNSYLLCKKGEFYKGWCELEQSEISIASVRKHVNFSNNNYHLEMIDYHIPKFQALFPYKVFFSPEFVGRTRCSICKEIIGPRKKCIHKRGEIYRGEICTGQLEQLEFLGLAMVENPVQKYSVAFIDGKDDFNYSLVQYYIECTESPFDAWGFTKTTKFFPHSHFTMISPEQKCPCDSKNTYQECCLQKDGVTMPHFQFHFTKVSQAAGLENKLILDIPKE